MCERSRDCPPVCDCDTAPCQCDPYVPDDCQSGCEDEVGRAAACSDDCRGLVVDMFQCLEDNPCDPYEGGVCEPLMEQIRTNCNTACGATRTVQRTYEDEGRACLTERQPQQDRPDGGEAMPGLPVAVHVVFDECAHYCARIDRAQCEAKLTDPSIITVTGLAKTSETISSDRSCASACLPVEATCELGAPLQAGTYTIAYGGSRQVVEVPGPDLCGSARGDAGAFETGAP